MKKLLPFIILLLSIFAAGAAKAQSFLVQYDTVMVSNFTGNTYDAIINTTTHDITLSWVVTATDFPSDWIAAAGICDNHQCYSAASLWTGTSGVSHTSNAYAPDSGDFHMQLTFPDTLPGGSHYMTVSLKDFTSGETKYETFIVNRASVGITPVVNEEDLNVYPNPARDEINVIFNSGADVKNIAVYNIIGKVMSVYRVSGNSANLNLRNVPAGIYFLRLLNSNGGVVATRKFTRQ
jgi:hypothetical protein